MRDISGINERLDKIINLLEIIAGKDGDQDEFFTLPNSGTTVNLKNIDSFSVKRDGFDKACVSYFLVLKKKNGDEDEKIYYGSDDEWHRGPFNSTSDRSRRTCYEDLKSLEDAVGSKDDQQS